MSVLSINVSFYQGFRAIRSHELTGHKLTKNGKLFNLMSTNQTPKLES